MEENIKSKRILSLLEIIENIKKDAKYKEKDVIWLKERIRVLETGLPLSKLLHERRIIVRNYRRTQRFSLNKYKKQIKTEQDIIDEGNIYLAEFDEYYKILDCEVDEYYKKLSSLEYFFLNIMNPNEIHKQE